MDSTVEYRPGFQNVFLLLFPQAFIVGLTVYLLATGQAYKGPYALGFDIFIGLFNLAMIGSFGYGVAVCLRSYLRFFPGGFSFRDVNQDTLSFQWKDVSGVSIQNVSGRNTIDYRVVVQLHDLNGFLRALPEKTRGQLQRRGAYLGDGIPIHTTNIQITRLQLQQEFNDRFSGSVIAPNATTPWSDPDPALAQASSNVQPVFDLDQYGTGASAAPTYAPAGLSHAAPGDFKIADHSTQVYRMKGSLIGIQVLIALVVLAACTFLFASAKNDPRQTTTMEMYGGLAAIAGVLLIGMTVYSASVSELRLEPEGLVVQTSSCPRVRVRWEEVAGVHVIQGPGGNGYIAMVDLRDFGSFLRSLDPDARRRFESRRAAIGDGIPISTQLFGVSAPELVRMILHRAGLPQSALNSPSNPNQA
jgi:hypothetical protein